MRYVGIVGGCVLVVVLIVIVTCVCCYRKRCHRDRVKYSVPKEQSLTQSVTHSFLSTQSSNVPVRSLDHSPRSSSVMYTTSFTDCGTSEQLASPLHNSRSNTNLNSFSNSNSLHLPNSMASSETADDVKDDVTETASYKGHQKRPSYHMMRELCYEDGNIVLADIWILAKYIIIVYIHQSKCFLFASLFKWREFYRRISIEFTRYSCR